MKITPNSAVMAAAREQLVLLEALVDDLRRIADGTAPTYDDLVDAPFLDAWVVTTRSERCLTGCVSGHPLLDGPVIKTSTLWSGDGSQGWARTYSRFYRLGDELT